MRRITPSRATGPRVPVLEVEERYLRQADHLDLELLLIEYGVDPDRVDLEHELDRCRMVRVWTLRRETDPRKLLERGRTA